MGRLMPDFRVALRGLRRAPAFATAVVLSLALGIGANAAMFTILDPVLLRPLPFAHADELVAASLGSTRGSFRILTTCSGRRRRTRLASIAEYNATFMTVGGTGAPEELPGAIASPDFARVLRVAPALGRFIAIDDGLPNAPPVAVLGYDIWQRRFGGDPRVLGRTITVNDIQTTVVGVMPAGFSFPARASLWLPRPPIDTRPGAGFRVGLVVGRRRTGLPTEQVQRELARVPRPADLQRAWSLRDSAVVVTSLHDELYGSARSTVALLFSAVTLLLLIACANVANLVLARPRRGGAEEVFGPVGARCESRDALLGGRHRVPSACAGWWRARGADFDLALEAVHAADAREHLERCRYWRKSMSGCCCSLSAFRSSPPFLSAVGYGAARGRRRRASTVGRRRVAGGRQPRRAIHAAFTRRDPTLHGSFVLLTGAGLPGERASRVSRARGQRISARPSVDCYGQSSESAIQGSGSSKSVLRRTRCSGSQRCRVRSASRRDSSAPSWATTLHVSARGDARGRRVIGSPSATWGRGSSRHMGFPYSRGAASSHRTTARVRP